MSYLVTELINDILPRIGRIKNEAGITFLSALNSIQSLINKELLRRKSDLIVDTTLNLIIKAEDYKAQLPDGFIAPAEKFKMRDVNGNWILLEVTLYDSVTGLLHGIVTDFAGDEATAGFQIAKTTNSEGTIVGETAITLTPGIELSADIDNDDIKISSVSGAEFIDCGTVIDLTKYIGKTITIEDSSGNQLAASILSASTAETLGTELITSYVDPYTSYDTLLTSTNTVLDAINASGSAVALSNSMTANSFGALMKFVAVANLVSGDAPTIQVLHSLFEEDCLEEHLIAPFDLTQGTTTLYKNVNDVLGFNDQKLNFSNSGATEWSASFSIKQVLTPASTGVMVDFTSVSTSFNFNDTNGYSITISDSVLSLACDTGMDIVSGDDVILFNEETDLSKVRLQPRYLNDSKEFDNEDEWWNRYELYGAYSANANAEIGEPSRYKIINKTLYIRPKPSNPIQITGKYFKVFSSLANSSEVPFNGLFDEIFREGIIRIIQKGIAIPEDNKDFMIFFNREFNTVVDVRNKILPKTRTHSSNYM